MVVQCSNEEKTEVLRGVISRAYRLPPSHATSQPPSRLVHWTKHSRTIAMNSAETAANSTDVLKLPLSVAFDQLEAGAQAIVARIRPEWKAEELKFKIFTDGITNRLIGVHRGQQSETILIRVYGEKTDLFIDRAKEVSNMNTMHQAGLAAAIHCTFLNGIAYGYTPGVVTDQSMVRHTHIATLIAQKMAKMHSLNPVHPEHAVSLFTGIRKFIHLLADAGHTDCKQPMHLNQLRQEASFLEKELPKLASPIVFCHNDLLLKNIIYSEDTHRVTFIDFEYSDYNFQAFDIANHFCEFCGVDTFQPELYPDVSFQRNWLHTYLTEWYKLSGSSQLPVTSEQIDKLRRAVDIFTLAAHFYWAVWALVQADNSTIDFDYRLYASQRLDQYHKRKHELYHNLS